MAPTAPPTITGTRFTGAHKGQEQIAIWSDGRYIITTGICAGREFNSLTAASIAIRGHAKGGFWKEAPAAVTAPPAAPVTSRAAAAPAKEQRQTMTTAETTEAPATERVLSRPRTTGALVEGEQFQADFKGSAYTATVVAAGDGKLKVIAQEDGKPGLFELDGETHHAGLSRAGKAITGYAVVAGQFWRPAGTPRPERKTRAAKPEAIVAED